MTSVLRSKLDGALPVRVLLSPLPAPFVVPLAAHAGFDAVAFDLEHSPRDEGVLQSHVAQARAEGIEAFVRLHPSEISTASRLLDLGVTGVLVPSIHSREDAEGVVRAMHYPPRGSRGFATISPAGGYGALSIRDVKANAESHTVVVAMIESSRGVESAEQIASVEGIDALFVGAVDLAVDLGVDDPAHPQVRAAADQVRAAAAAAGAAFLQPGGDGAFVLHNLARLLSGAFTAALGSRG